MKKVLMLVCALALVAGANAQVKQTKEVHHFSTEMSLFQSPRFSSPSKAAAKVREDTMAVQSVYRAGNPGLGLGHVAAYGLPQDPNATAEETFITPPVFFTTTGTGFLNYWYGSGEVGYSYDFTENGWYESVLQRGFAKKGVTAALAYITRFRSPIPEVDQAMMPFRFKIYTSVLGQVTEQTAYTDIMSDNARNNQVTVYYPNNPENYVSYSEEIQIPSMDLEYQGSDIYLPGERYSARFITPAIAGENFCISAMFPCNHDEKDTLWKAFLLTVRENRDYVISDRPAAVYAVIDFQYQEIFGTETELWREREEGYFLPNEADQENKRYAVVPLRSWVWSGGNASTEEPAFQIVMADGVDIERGASYDKYVEVKINPAIDYTIIRAADRINRVEIYNLSGRLVKSQVCNDNDVRIALNGLSSGMYVAKVTTDGGIASKKIMVR